MVSNIKHVKGEPIINNNVPSHWNIFQIKVKKSYCFVNQTGKISICWFSLKQIDKNGSVI
jgi:hypothetical protein